MLWLICRVWATATGLTVWLPPPLPEMWVWRRSTVAFTWPLLVITRISFLTLIDTRYICSQVYIHAVLLWSLSVSLPLPLSPIVQIVCYCYTKPLEETSSSEPGGEPQASDSSAPAAAVSQSSPNTMKEKARTHRLIFSRHHHLSPQSRAGSFQPDAVPLAAFTKVRYYHNALPLV